MEYSAIQPKTPLQCNPILPGDADANPKNPTPNRAMLSAENGHG
jgi:hypothetical protein